jgi:hypothetical protein
MMIDVSATEKEGSSMQSYPAMTALRGFEMINVMDKTQVFRTFRMAATNSHHLPHASFRRLYSSSLQRFLTSGSCESTSFLFARSNIFGGCMPSASTPFLSKMNTFGG